MKIYTDQTKIKYSSEQIIFYGLLNTLPKEATHCYNHEGKSRYGNIIEFCKRTFTYVNNIQECDIIVLPYKFKGAGDELFKEFNIKSKQYGKPLWCFFNDDYDKPITLDDNVTIFRTSFYKSKQLKNEKAMPAFSPDYYKGEILKNPELTIGYCGHTMHGRKEYLEQLEKSDMKTNFIYRNGFWAPDIPKDRARKEYFENMEKNLFIFCHRGAGNFSYRFYETLMMGRIPILVDTDGVFPDGPDIETMSVVIRKGDDMVEKIRDFYANNNLTAIQKGNRKIWIECYSPMGFLNNLRYEREKYKIGIMIPTTSRNRKWVGIKNSYLYRIFLRSFLLTYCKEHTYVIYVGFDEDDPLFSNENERSELDRFISIMKNVELKWISLRGIKRGHLTVMWNGLFKMAYDEKCDYFYQCGDDIEMVDKGWVNDSIHILKMNNDIGVSGPLEKMQRRVLTQSFVSRQHMEIFGCFFPPEIINWYCDNWITLIYTRNHFFFPIYDKWCMNVGGKERYPIVKGFENQSMAEICDHCVKKYEMKLKQYVKDIKFSNRKELELIMKKKIKKHHARDHSQVEKRYKNLLQRKSQMVSLNTIAGIEKFRS
jgi:hypothetical protein